MEPLTWYLAQRGLATSAPAYLGAVTALQAYSRRLIHFFERYDVLLTPSLGRRPLPIGTIDTAGADLEAEFAKAGDFTPFTAVWNTTGQPAIALPLYHGDDGLPVGIQLVGPPLGEGLLLSLATQLEAAHPWADRQPAT